MRHRFATRRLVDAETPLVFSSVLISLAQAVYPKMDKDSLDTLVLDHMLGLARDLDRVLPASDEDDLTSLKVARCLQAHLHIKRHLTVVACMGRHQQVEEGREAGTVLARASAADDVVGTDPVKMVAAAEQGESYDDAWLDALCAESADLSEVQRLPPQDSCACLSGTGRCKPHAGELPPAMAASTDALPPDTVHMHDRTLCLTHDEWGRLQIEDASLLKLRCRIGTPTTPGQRWTLAVQRLQADKRHEKSWKSTLACTDSMPGRRGQQLHASEKITK
ncbi:unnamed protein product [Lampetra planeri]